MSVAGFTKWVGGQRLVHLGLCWEARTSVEICILKGWPDSALF